MLRVRNSVCTKLSVQAPTNRTTFCKLRSYRNKRTLCSPKNNSAMMQGCHTPPPPPPNPMVSPLACQVGSLFGLVAFPVGLVWPRPLPPPLWSGTCGLFGWPRPACGGSVFYRGMVWLLPLVSSNVIVTCLVPSSPPVGWGLWSFWLAPPRLCGAVCSTEIWYGCCRL